MPDQDGKNWLSSLAKFAVFDDFHEEVEKLTRKFILMIDDGDQSEEIGLGKISRISLRCLIGERWMNDTFISWMIKTINKQSPDALAFAYADSVFEGKLRDFVVQKFAEKSRKEKKLVRKLIVFLNVGRSTFSDNPLYKKETYIGMFTDKKGTNYMPNHYSLLIVNIESGSAFYGDSLAWRTPITLISDVDNWTEQLLGKRDIIQSIQECHDTKYDKSPGFHTCRRSVCSSSFPLQTCNNVCGTAMLICGAIASFDNILLNQLLLVNTRGSSQIKFLKNVFKFSDSLKVVLIKWYMTGVIEVNDILCISNISIVKRKSVVKSKNGNDQEYLYSNEQAVHQVDDSVSKTGFGETFSIHGDVTLNDFNGYQWKEVGDKNRKRKLENRKRGENALDTKYECS